MLDENSTPHASPFDAIRHIDENGNEYWSARELYKVLGYTEWRNFNNIVIKRAMKACEENGRVLSEHFVRSYKVSVGGQGAKQKITDVQLSRYAAYLVVMNSDPNMPVVAIGQEYFAIQTRRQELANQLATLPENEDQKRLELRNEIMKWAAMFATPSNAKVVHCQKSYLRQRRAFANYREKSTNVSNNNFS